MPSAQQQHPLKHEKRLEITSEAVWLVSSCKSGHEIGHMHDGSPDTFWQSDGPLPHVITILLNEAHFLTDLELYLDYQIDESYTPLEIVIRVGLQRHYLQDLHVLEMEEPKGWVSIPLLDMDDMPLPAHVIQLCILSNFQDGRDARIRGMRIFSVPPSFFSYNMNFPAAPTPISTSNSSS